MSIIIITTMMPKQYIARSYKAHATLPPFPLPTQAYNSCYRETLLTLLDTNEILEAQINKVWHTLYPFDTAPSERERLRDAIYEMARHERTVGKVRGRDWRRMIGEQRRVEVELRRELEMVTIDDATRARLMESIRV
ncbi:MAG: hypothetical protein M1827_007206 [Pycnora praestabilis]|nr:MAG: hypothetical protein M1827_007206 [Pycnora praestabilis]